MVRDDPDVGEARDLHNGILTTIAPRHWGPNVFGVVSDAEIRRRPGDVARVGLSALVVVLTAVAAGRFTAQQARVYDLLTDLPGWLRSGFGWIYDAGTTGAVLVVVIALLLTRRWLVVLRIAGAALLAWVGAVALRDWVDAQSVRAASFQTHQAPQYPVVRLAVATAALLVVVPFLVRPARRAVVAVFSLGAVCAGLSVVGLPGDVVGSVALGWGVAAIVHLAFGTPAATPTLGQIVDALRDVGVSVTGLRLAERQVWGETRFRARGPDDEPVSVEVLARDAADARLMAKVGRSFLYRDSGPSLALTRPQQLEHRAYLLLLAAGAGVPVSGVVIAGMAGSHEDALLVLHDPEGMPLNRVDAASITDAVLADAWGNVGRLHEARLTHGQLTADNVLVRDDATTALVDFAYGSAASTHERAARDCVELLATTAELVGVDRALAAAHHALGDDGLAELLPLMEPAALSAAARREIVDRKKLFAELRTKGAALVHEDEPKLTELRRVSFGQIVMAAATFLGFYLIVNQFAGVDLWATLQNAQVEWVVVTALLSPLPQITGAIALTGAVSAPLPFGPVVAEQYANNFTGLIGGTLANTALIIRFFQKQGMTVAVAASSGVLTSLANGMLQVVLVVVGLLVTGSNFDFSDTGGTNNLGKIIVIGLIVAGVLVAIALLIPRLRRLVRGIVQPQLQSARDNLKGILSTPRKAALLFGGQLASQVLFAMILAAALHAYGYSLPLFQLIVINSLASVVGGMAPVPGGMGVVEAGLIAGLTAAGIPQDVAVATTFTARLFTAYLPPIYGWFALTWLRRNDYV